MKMGFMNFAKDLVADIHERTQTVSARKEKFERIYKDQNDDELFRAIACMPPKSADFEAMSLLLQDRGFLNHEIVQRYKYYK